MIALLGEGWGLGYMEWGCAHHCMRAQVPGLAPCAQAPWGPMGPLWPMDSMDFLAQKP